MDGSLRLMQYERTQDLLEQIELYRNPETVPEWMMPIRPYIYVRESDRKDIGVIQIRLWLNEYQQHYGGRIGYSICPGERRKDSSKTKPAEEPSCTTAVYTNRRNTSRSKTSICSDIGYPYKRK